MKGLNPARGLDLHAERVEFFRSTPFARFMRNRAAASTSQANGLVRVLGW